MEKEKLITLIKDSLNEISIYIGTSTLKIVLERIFYDLSVYNPEWESIKISDPEEVDFSKFSPEELKKFYQMFVDIIGNILGEEFKEELLRKVEKEG
ncbi:MAG: hypothetical protein DRG27_02965 [Deltaproteobacteria bacterium]|nr:MAG: hypothetical protein DRG27_02965 [Deltaproteobacteria bacterium]